MTLLGVLVRFVQLGAALGLIGIFTMLLLAGRSDRATAHAWEARVLSLMRCLVVVLLFSGVVALVYQAVVASGRAGALLDPATWRRLMLETQVGTVWMIRHGLLLLLAGLVLLREREISAADWIAWRAEGWALATAGAAAMAWAGHAAAAEPWGLAAALADALHITAAGAWLGALLPLVLLLFAASREAGADARPFAVLAVRRFSTMALTVMLAIVATGLWNAWVQVGSVPALIGTPYGWLLLAKVALLIPILGLAALGRRRLLPALSGEAAAVGRPAMAHLARFVAWELGLAALILAVTSGLALTAPARHDAPYWPLSYRLAYDVMVEGPGVKTRLLIGSQIAVLGLVGGATALFLKRQAALLLAAAVAAVVAGLWVALPPLAVDAYPTTYLRSTVPYQAASIASGIELYVAHCAACHGRGGSGDGPAGAGLPRRPADLTAPHTGQHTAGDLFWWLTHGIPAGGMPPFGGALSAEDRWDVINFLRALSAGQEARILSPLVEPGRAWLAAPDFTFAVGPSPARSLKELRGRRTVLLVLFSLPSSAPRMRDLAEVYGELQFLGAEIIAVPMSADPGILARLGGDPPVLYPVVTDGAADIVRAYALFGRTLAPAGLRPELPAPAHMELLIDRQGYIRARWIPGEGRASWSDLTTLRDEIQILAGEVAAPPPDEHVH
jgi:putative copper resistance protein D